MFDMKQVCQIYFCHYLNRKIGNGLCCFSCSHCKRDDAVLKKCVYEEVVDEFVRDV